MSKKRNHHLPPQETCRCWLPSANVIAVFFRTGGNTHELRPNEKFLRDLHPATGICKERRCGVVYSVIQDYLAAWMFGGEVLAIRGDYRAETLEYKNMKVSDFAAIARWVDKQLGPGSVS